MTTTPTTDHDTETCCACGGDDLCLYDGTLWLCWDCCDQHNIDTASTPKPDAFAKFTTTEKD